jgi:hypothetical protein
VRLLSLAERFDRRADAAAASIRLLGFLDPPHPFLAMREGKRVEELLCPAVLSERAGQVNLMPFSMSAVS